MIFHNTKFNYFPIDMITSKEILQTNISKTSWQLTELRDRVLSQQVTKPINSLTKIEWSKIKQSQYIETIILGFPLNQIILAAHENSEELTVVDGYQRINSIVKFYGKELPSQDPLKLQNLRIRTELNGMTYKDIQSNSSVPDLTAIFDRKLIDITIIKNYSLDIIKEIQTRINT